jgi:hypothetical protein
MFPLVALNLPLMSQCLFVPLVAKEFLKKTTRKYPILTLRINRDLSRLNQILKISIKENILSFFLHLLPIKVL